MLINSPINGYTAPAQTNGRLPRIVPWGSRCCKRTTFSVPCTALAWVRLLVKANKPFDQFVYPDRNHGIYGGTTRLHLFELMTKWLEENL